MEKDEAVPKGDDDTASAEKESLAEEVKDAIVKSSYVWMSKLTVVVIYLCICGE